MMKVLKNYDLIIKMYRDLLDETLEAKEKKMEEISSKGPPENIRPMVAEDVEAGAYFWCDCYDGWVVLQIEEVYRPNDDFKAFETECGRLGLYGSYVEVKEKK